MQIRKGQRGVKGEWVEGGGWHQTQSHRHGDDAVYSAPTTVDWPTAEPITTICKEMHGEYEEGKRRNKRGYGREDTDSNLLILTLLDRFMT